MISLTIISNAGKQPLTKSFELLPDGTLQKSTAAKLRRGRAQRVEVTNIQGFADLLESVESHQALAYGVTDNPDVEIVIDEVLRSHPGAISRTRKHFSFRSAPTIMLLDHDPAPDASPLAADELRDRLIEGRPELREAPMAAMASASSFIHDGKGELRGSGGWHLYVAIADGSDVERAGRALYEHCWRNGAGRFIVSKSGQLLDRNLIDASIWQPERLDFAAGALCVPPLEQHRPEIKIWNADAPPCDTRRIAELTADEKETVSKHRTAARAAVEDERKRVREAYCSERVAELTALGIDAAQAAEIIDQALDHRVLLGDFVLTTSDGERVTVAEVLTDKRKFHARRFADPLEPDYRDDGRIAHANLHGGGRPYIYSHAHGGRRFELYPQPRVLRLQRGELPRLADRAIELIRIADDVYDQPTGRGRYRLVYVREGYIVAADDAWLRDYLGRLVKCEKYDKRSKAWDPADVPPELVIAIQGRAGDRNLPKLEAVISDPTMRLDGSILDTQGYSTPDRTLFVTDETDPPRIPEDPTNDEVRTAFKIAWRAVAEFPFVDAAARGVMMAAMLTAVVRPMLPTAPAFAFDAPKAGSGKSLLAECICWLCGVPPPVDPPPPTDEEARKTLFAASRGGARAVFWDNFTQPVYGNSAVCAFLTASQFSQRILGHSEVETVPNRAMLLLTGNNLRIQGDACRRVLVCRIDAELEHPETRSFDLAPAQWVRDRRTEIRTALLTILRAYRARGTLKQTNDTAGSFEHWDALVRQCVVWLGRSGLTDDAEIGDPFETALANIDTDPQAGALSELMQAWRAHFGDKRVSAAEALRIARDAIEPGAEALHEAIKDVEEGGAPFTPKRFGKWLWKHRDEPIDGLKIVTSRDLRTKNHVYAVSPLKEAVSKRKTARAPQMDPLLL